MTTFGDKFDSEKSRRALHGGAGFDYAGVCRAASELPVDFLEMDCSTAGEFTFAIGDAALAPDPLPVLCVKHCLHRSPARELANPSSIARRMNGLIYDCCEAKCSLTCFYAQCDRDTRVLRYVNAGHDAPVLIRGNSPEVCRLETGGPVFGLQESPRYVEGFVPLRKGDRLVAFSHGLIDALAAHGGSAEEVLISIVRRHPNCRAAELANLIDAECEDDGSGAPGDRSIFVAVIEGDRFRGYAAAVEEALCTTL